MVVNIKRDTLVILQIFILIIIGFIIKDKFFNKKTIESFQITSYDYYDNNIVLFTYKPSKRSQSLKIKNITKKNWVNIRKNRLFILDRDDTAFNSYTSNDLKSKLDLNNLPINNISGIKLPIDYYAILYKDENMKIDNNKLNKAFTTNSSVELINHYSIYNNRIKSINIYSQKDIYEEKIIDDATKNNQIYLFSETDYLGNITSIEIKEDPDTQFNNIVNNNNSLTIKSIIIPQNKNINLEFSNNDNQKYIKNNKIVNITSSKYKITPYYNNIDYITANKVLEKNKPNLDTVKQKLNNLIQQKIENDQDLKDKNYILRLSMIDIIKNTLVNIKRKINYNINYY